MEKKGINIKTFRNTKKLKQIKDNLTENNFSNEKITLYVLTRDFRILDNSTLYSAYEHAKKTNSSLCVIFRFHPDQIFESRNAYFSSHAVQFMVESLEIFSKEITINFIEPCEDIKYESFLKNMSIIKIFIMKDFTPFARKRLEFYSKIAPTEEIDDATVFPINDIPRYNKLNYFYKHLSSLDFPKLKHLEVDWISYSSILDPNNTEEKISHHEHDAINKIFKKYKILYKENKELIVHADELNKYLEDLSGNIKGYSVKKIRECLGEPKVSYLSAFIKFGMVSIRDLHLRIKASKGISKEDKDAFERQLYARDFFYKLAWDKPNEVYESPNWQGEIPRFISEEDCLKFKKQISLKGNLSKEEFKEIENANQVYFNFCNAETEFPLINASISQMKNSGYMLNRTRMMVTSYLTQDHKLWWKYAERFFAQFLIDYDWTINTMNHQNMAKIGLWPKITLNFSIKKQEATNKADKLKYINKFLKK
jgi:deoxyribodipyrimidine photo-lyase